jgi:uncharacterized membrane protein
MSRQTEENTVSIIQKAVRYFRIPVTKSSVKKALKSNPYYPSFKSICDTLNEWSVENHPLKYKREELQELTPPYIVHFESGGGQIAFVTDINKNKVTYYDSYKTKRKIKLDEFINNCSGAVIILNPDEKSGEKNYHKKWQNEFISSAVLPVIILTFLLFVFHTIFNPVTSGIVRFDGIIGILMLTKVIGIVLSLLLVFHEFEIRSTLTDKICHLSKATNCSAVLNDKAAKIFGWFGWADAGFVFFTGGLLFLFSGINQSGLTILAILSALAIPYPVFSIYYQGFVLKKWCPFCLGVQLVLIAEFILLLPVFSNLVYSSRSMVSILLIFLIMGITYSLFIMYTREKISNEDNYYKYLGFKKNPEILKILLLKHKHYDIPVTSTSLVFGKKDSSLIITAFLSLHCSHCARAFNRIREILRSDVKATINIVLVSSDSKIINTLYHFKQNNKDNEALVLMDQWYNMDPYSRNKISETLCIPDADEVSDEVGNENNKLFKECGVIGTPTFFINGYQLPHQYDIDDIKYFSEIFTESKEV